MYTGKNPTVHKQPDKFWAHTFSIFVIHMNIYINTNTVIILKIKLVSCFILVYHEYFLTSLNILKT